MATTPAGGTQDTTYTQDTGVQGVPDNSALLQQSRQIAYKGAQDSVFENITAYIAQGIIGIGKAIAGATGAVRGGQNTVSQIS